MDWAILALVSAAVYGLVSVLDKYLVDRSVRNIRTVLFIFGALGFISGAPFLFSDLSFQAYSIRALGAGIVSGLLRGFSLAGLIMVLRREEVSRALPITQTYPIFVAILASIFSSEQIGAWDWVAILIIVSGSILLSVRRTMALGESLLLSSAFPLLLLSSFGIGLSNFLGKAALAELSLVQVFALNFCLTGIAVMAISATRDAMQETWEIIRYRRRHMIIYIADGLLALLGTYLLFASFDSGPVSGASALNATRPLFVFAFAVLVSWLAPRWISEPLALGVLAIKFTAIGMIVAGTGLLLSG